MLYYCKKCGRIIWYFDGDMPVCDYCKNNVFPVPEHFLGSKLSINSSMEEQFINEYIKASPEFDQELYERREKYKREHADDFRKSMEDLAHGKAILEGRDKGNKFGIECPYCHATNVKKISGLSKAGSVAMFGVFALGKTSKQWHCNHCSSDF